MAIEKGLEPLAKLILRAGSEIFGAKHRHSSTNKWET